MRSRYSRITVLAVAFAALIHQQSQAQWDRELTVEVGDQATFSADGVRSYSVGTRGVVDVRLTDDQSQFVLVGLQSGQTTILLIMRNGSQKRYRVTVPSTEGPSARVGAIEDRENIRLDLYFVQLTDSYSHAVGIAFPGSVGGGNANFQMSWAQGSGTTSNFQLVTQALLPRIDIAQSKGWAKVYRQASVVVVNGEQAQVSIGGEVNLIVTGGLSGNLQTITFGTRLTCFPRYDAQTGRIEIRLETDVSDLTTGEQVPGRSTSVLNTLVNLELGQAIVLGGVIARSETRSRTGLPGLSQIPILGALFGSHTAREDESETLLFIVPTVVEPVELQQRNLIQEAIRLFDDYDGGVDEVELMQQPRILGARQRARDASLSGAEDSGEED